MRELVQAAARLGNAHPLQPFDNALLCGGALEVLVARQHLGHLRADRHVRRQRRQRVLEDHRDMRAADLVELLTRKTGKLAALELDRALDNTVGRGEAHGGQHRLALARSAFADKAEAFASRNAEGQLLHGLDAAVLRLE